MIFEALYITDLFCCSFKYWLLCFPRFCDQFKSSLPTCTLTCFVVFYLNLSHKFSVHTLMALSYCWSSSAPNKFWHRKLINFWDKHNEALTFIRTVIIYWKFIKLQDDFQRPVEIVSLSFQLPSFIVWDFLLHGQLLMFCCEVTEVCCLYLK